MSATETGLVLRIDAKVCHVEVAGATHKIPLRGRLFEGGERRPVAVGDLVDVTLEGGGGAIDAVRPRTSKLSRQTADREHEQVIAANLTRVFVVASLGQPPFQPTLVDRILAGAACQDLDAALVLTKRDMDRRGTATELEALYQDIGYPVYVTSIAEGEESRDSLDKLREDMGRNRSLFYGASGVGKSSLINHLVPGLQLRIGDLSRIRLGKHTTTATQLIPLPGGGHVLDTPGIRNFGLFGVGTQELGFWFREFQPFLQQCGYRNCTHSVEPDCAVRDAVAAGDLAPSRYESYRTVLAEVEAAS